MEDGKEPGALRTIGEVAAALGVKQHVLRYWEQQFPMLRPLKRSGGRRYYRREDVELLTRIDTLINREGYTLKGARLAIEKMRGGPAVEVELVEAQPAQAELVAELPDNSELLSQLKDIRARLARALEATA